MSLKSKFLDAAALRIGKVTIDDVEYTLREVDAASFSDYADKQKTDQTEANALLIHQSLLDENGELMLTLEEARVAAKSGRMVRPIIQKALELSGLAEPENKPVAN